VVPSLDLKETGGERRAADVAAIAASAPSVPQRPAATTTIEKVAHPTPAAVATVQQPAKASEPFKAITTGAVSRSGQQLVLTKEIQRELQRVGCYAGDIDGEWSAQTRAAMKSFVDRVNATLPVDAPDHILKTLVSGHPGEACGKSCPAGQTAGANGRCLPTQVIAQSPRKSAGTDQPRLARAPATREVATAAAVPVARAPAVQRERSGTTSEAVVSSWAPTVVAAPVPQFAIPQPRPAHVVTAAAPPAHPSAFPSNSHHPSPTHPHLQSLPPLYPSASPDPSTSHS
jgi:hypothetical protein